MDSTLNDDDISATAAGVGLDATVDIDDDDISVSATAIDTLSPAITATIVSTVNKAVTAAVTAAIEASLGDAIVLTKITSVDTLVGGRLITLEGRLDTLESKMGSTQANAASERATGLEPPDATSDNNSPHAATPPNSTALPGHMGAHAGGYVDARGDTPGTADVRATGTVPPVVYDDGSVTYNSNTADLMNATERSRQAFAHARARARTTPRASIAPRQKVSPVRNPYPPTTPHRHTLCQTTIPETIGRATERHVRVETSPDGDEPNTGASRPDGFRTERGHVDGYQGLERTPSDPYFGSHNTRNASARSDPQRYDDPVPQYNGRPRDVDVDYGSNNEAHLPQGGQIVTPQHWDRRQIAHSTGHSPLDAAALACREYHGYRRGYYPLTAVIVRSCGYRDAHSGVTPYCNDIILLHRRVMDAWENRRTQQSGPSVDRILEKGLPVFPKLDSLDVAATVTFYDKLQKTSALFLLPLMLFDAINLNMGFEGLCPPGLGLP